MLFQNQAKGFGVYTLIIFGPKVGGCVSVFLRLFSEL